MIFLTIIILHTNKHKQQIFVYIMKKITLTINFNKNFSLETKEIFRPQFFFKNINLDK